MDKGKKPQKQQEKYKEGYLPYVDIQAFEEGIIKSYADPQKCLLKIWQIKGIKKQSKNFVNLLSLWV